MLRRDVRVASAPMVAAGTSCHRRNMRTNPTPTALRMPLTATAVVALVVAAGCGNEAAADESESAPCDAVREWAIHELQPVDETDPVAFRGYWQEWTAFQTVAVDTAPETIKADWELKFGLESEIFTPILERYDFDVVAIAENGTPEEQAATEAPPDVQAAQLRLFTHESEVCGAQQPLAAPSPSPARSPVRIVSSSGHSTGRPPRRSRAGIRRRSRPCSMSSRRPHRQCWQPRPTASGPMSPRWRAWTTGRQRQAFERHGYDLRALLRGGPQQDRLDVNHADEAIREQFSRVRAYAEQVCGA